MDLPSLNVVLWQVCLIEALICLILLVGIILATSRWRIAIRRAVSGVGRGAVTRAKKEAAAKAEREAAAKAEREAVAKAEREAAAKARREAAARAERGAGALKRFSSAVAEYAMHLKRYISAVLGILGYPMSSLTKRREKRAAKLERFSSDMAEYAAHLKNHASAIDSLTQASQELKEEVSRQHRILSDLAKAIEKAPARLEPRAEPKAKPEIIKEHISPPAAVSEQAPPMEEELVAKLEKESQIPGHFRYRRQPDEEREIATKEAPAKKLSLATRHTLATKEALASKAHLTSTM